MTVEERRMAPTRARTFLDTREAAAYLGRNTRWIERASADRLIPFYKVGGKRLFDRHDLDAYLDACRVEAGA
jgi:excisionase family DNA binding protein